MMSPFSCVAGSFNNEEEREIEEFISSSPCTTPKRSSRKASRDSKNPYADRGLDKFSALLAELEGKKQKIYTQKGSEDISFVRFVYSKSNDWKPVVFKSKDRKQDQQQNPHSSITQVNKDKQQKKLNQEPGQDAKHAIKASNEQQKAEEPKKKSMGLKSDGFGLKILRHPRYYLPVVILFILMLLALYGRSFAILCTSVGWYLVPWMRERSSSSSSGSDNSKNKQDYARRSSDKNMTDDKSSPPRNPMLSSSPKSVLSGPAAEKPNGLHSHRKSF